jgi:hypothetical protein
MAIVVVRLITQMELKLELRSETTYGQSINRADAL